MLIIGIGNCGSDSILTGPVTTSLGERDGRGQGAGVTALVNGISSTGGIIEGTYQEYQNATKLSRYLYFLQVHLHYQLKVSNKDNSNLFFRSSFGFDIIEHWMEWCTYTSNSCVASSWYSCASSTSH